MRYTDNTEGEYKLWFHHVELVGADGDEPNETVSGAYLRTPSARLGSAFGSRDACGDLLGDIGREALGGVTARRWMAMQLYRCADLPWHAGDVMAAPPLAPHTLNDTYSVYTHMTVEEASRAGVTVCGEERVVKRRKYGPYTIAQLWERWGVRGKHLTVWNRWRKFKVGRLPGHSPDRVVRREISLYATEFAKQRVNGIWCVRLPVAQVKPDNGEGNFTLGELMDDYSSSRKYNRRPRR